MIGPKFYAWDKNGKPLAFGKLYTYQARTNNPKDTYQSEDQVVENTNPVILNGEGYANVYLSGSYKMVLKDSDENEIWSSDPVSSSEPSEWVLCLTANYSNPTSFKVNGNFTSQYEVGRRVRIDNNSANYAYSTISSSIFAGGETTLTITDPVITTGIVESCISIVGPQSTNTNQVFDFETLQKARDSSLLKTGDAISIEERIAGQGGGAMWDVVETTSVTPNGNGIVVGLFDGDISFILRNGSINTETSITDTIQTTNGFDDIDPPYIAELKALGDVASDSDGVTIKRKNIKSWKKPTGIKDSAVAASFILNDGVSEPATQVSGFVDIDAIGVQTSRDAVAVFAQVDSAPSLLVTSGTTFTATTIVSPDFFAIWDDIEVGLICDVNFGAGGWVGAVITSKSGTDTLNIQSWRNIDGVSGLATTPTNGTTGGANQAIGIEVGVSAQKVGSGALSKGFLAVNLGGERPGYGYSMTGSWGRGYTSGDANIYGFGSFGDGVGFIAENSVGNSFESEDPTGHHIEFRDSTSSSQFIVTNAGLLALGTNAESGQARLNIRGDGDTATAYSETEVQIYDPTLALGDRECFYIAQEFPGGSTGGNIFLGTGNTSNHTYNLNIQTNNIVAMKFRHQEQNVEAGTDNTQTFGTAAKRWSEIFAGNSVINTSDEREKELTAGFTTQEQAVAVRLKALLTKYKWLKSIDREDAGGNKARIHIGIGAQSLGQAFTDEGLNPDDYAMFCYDEWEADEGNEAGSRFGVRLDQVLAFILANT